MPTPDFRWTEIVNLARGNLINAVHLWERLAGNPVTHPLLEEAETMLAEAARVYFSTCESSGLTGR